jgi:DNA-binding transcriptional LysR family regulator
MSSQELADDAEAYAKSLQLTPGGIPDWDDFRVLLMVVKMGSFRRAAEALGSCQPTVSRRIARLEETIGARVVERVNSGASVTVEGQLILQELEIAHSALQRAIHHAQARQRETDGVTLVMTDGIATYWMSRFLDRFFTHHPEVGLTVSTMNDTVSDRRPHFDLSIHFLPLSDPTLLTVRLGTLHFLPYASPQYLERYGRPRTLAELSRHRLVDVLMNMVDKGTWASRLADNLVSERTQMLSNSSAVACEAIRRGAGIGLLPTYASVFEQDLVPIEMNLKFETQFWLCYRRASLPKPAVQKAVAFLKHIFNHRTMPWFAERYISPSRFPSVTVDGIMKDYVDASGPIPLRRPAIAHAE